MEQPTTLHRERLIWVGVGLTFALVVLALGLAALRLARSVSKPLPVLSTVAEFSLTNQLGNRVSLKDLQGKIWVADIIFTRCAGPCLRMSRQMQQIQSILGSLKDVQLVSLTTDPDYDSPSVLKKYGERFEANPMRWWFLTGTRKEIAGLATDSLKLTALEKPPQEQQNSADLFIHSTFLVVVDKQARLRALIETGGEDTSPQQVQKQVLAAIRRLEHEK